MSPLLTTRRALWWPGLAVLGAAVGIAAVLGVWLGARSWPFELGVVVVQRVAVAAGVGPADEVREQTKTARGKNLVKQYDSLAYAAKALASYRAGDLAETRRFALRSFKLDPRRAGDRQLRSLFLESIVGSPLTNRVRQIKRQVVGEDQHLKSS